MSPSKEKAIEIGEKRLRSAIENLMKAYLAVGLYTDKNAAREAIKAYVDIVLS